jgi:uncharacterized 2Fe-2S/4Fe-4S cluster protein (DUF4445 family)
LADLILLLDIGTTTISADIIGSKGFKSIAGGAVLNSQHEIGEDIISRIDFSVKNRQNAVILQQKAADSVNRLIRNIFVENHIKGEDIERVFCACNSAMHHIFLGIDAKPLITPPYKISQKSETTVYADMIGLKIRKRLQVTFLPNIGGFVGSDALCAVLASRIYKSKDLVAVIDIGTNGEIILGNMHRILAASTAAGPAFEARYVKNGMPAVKGAISGVEINKDKIKLDVIGNCRPKGITGSGLIDACYQLYKNGFIDKSGKMQAAEYILYNQNNKKIVITQLDIRKLQLAKGAMLAGMKVLLKRYKADASGIQQVILTGSFGAHLNAESVLGIGLIPEIGKTKVRYIQNGVLKGLKRWARDKKIQTGMLSILNKIEHIPLFGKAFGKEFADSLQF